MLLTSGKTPKTIIEINDENAAYMAIQYQLLYMKCS